MGGDWFMVIVGQARGGEVPPTCPVCNAPLVGMGPDGTTPADAKKGDFCLCGRCQHFLRLEASGTWRRATADEQRDHFPDFAQDLIRFIQQAKAAQDRQDGVEPRPDA